MFTQQPTAIFNAIWILFLLHTKKRIRYMVFNCSCIFSRNFLIGKKKIEFTSGYKYVLKGENCSEKSWRDVGIWWVRDWPRARSFCRNIDSREKNRCRRNEVKTPSMSRAKNVAGYRDTTAKRGQTARVGTFPGDNDPLVLLAPRVISFRFPVARAIGFRLSYVLIPAIFPVTGDRWRSFRFSMRSLIGYLCIFIPSIPINDARKKFLPINAL